MWQRFTERARRVILLGQEEAGKMRSSHVDSEHLLLGLIRENDGVGAQILAKLEISAEQVRQAIAKEIQQPTATASDEPTLTPRAKRVLELAADEAVRMKHNYIGTEHLLLALIREKEGLAGQVLRKLGLDLETARREVNTYLGPIEETLPKHPQETQRFHTSTALLREIRSLNVQLNAIHKSKAAAIFMEDYEEAERLRIEARGLEQHVDDLWNRWENTSTHGHSVERKPAVLEATSQLITLIGTALDALQNNDTTQLDEVKANLGKLKEQLETKEPEL